MATNFDSLIAEKKKQIESLLTQLQQMRTDWTEAAKKFAAQWFLVEARERLKSRSDVVDQLGAAGVAELKREVEALSKLAPKLVDEQLGQDGRWPHLYKDSNGGRLDPYALKSQRSTVDPEKGFRKVLWQIYPLLSNRNIALVDPDFMRAGASEQSYPYAVPSDQTLSKIQSAYWAAYAQLAQADTELADLERRKKQSEIEDLWDKA